MIVDKSKSKLHSAFLRYNVLYNLIEIKTTLSSSHIAPIAKKKMLQISTPNRIYLAKSCYILVNNQLNMMMNKLGEEKTVAKIGDEEDLIFF